MLRTTGETQQWRWLHRGGDPGPENPASMHTRGIEMGLKGKEVDRLEWWFKKQKMRQQRLRKWQLAWQLKLEVCAARAREPQDANWTPYASYSSQTLFWMSPHTSKGRRAEGHRTEKIDVWVQDIRDRRQVEKEHLLAALERASGSGWSSEYSWACTLIFWKWSWWGFILRP